MIPYRIRIVYEMVFALVNMAFHHEPGLVNWLVILGFIDGKDK